METYAKRSIRHCIDMIAPFELSDQQEKNGPLQFYQFMHSLYREMYQRSEEYMVFPEPYEVYMAKLKKQGVQQKKEKEHVTNARESTLRNTFQQAIQFYALYLYRIGVKSKEIDKKTGALMIRKEDYSEVMEQMNRIHESQYNAGRYIFYMRRTTIYICGSKNSFLRDCANAGITRGLPLAVNPAASAGCQTGLK